MLGLLNVGNRNKVAAPGNVWCDLGVLSSNPIKKDCVRNPMSASNSAQITNLYQVVADIQEQMEESGYSSEVVDAIVSRGLAILFGNNDDDN
tara:strand:+ start:93 stop:368 length:276 start_codon:yes stop_codon:yes gene_type:complete